MMDREGGRIPRPRGTMGGGGESSRADAMGAEGWEG